MPVQSISAALTSEIENFIERRFSDKEVVDNFSYGNCYYFAVILNHRYPDLEIVYLPIKGHFCVQDKYNNYYDVRGKIDIAEIKTDKPIKPNTLALTDPTLFKRILRDCAY